jgi:hypothetical protein
MELVKALVGVELGTAKHQVKQGQSGQVRSRKLVQRIAKQPVYDQASVKTSKEISEY